MLLLIISQRPITAWRPHADRVSYWPESAPTGKVWRQNCWYYFSGLRQHLSWCSEKRDVLLLEKNMTPLFFSCGMWECWPLPRVDYNRDLFVCLCWGDYRSEYKNILFWSDFAGYNHLVLICSICLSLCKIWTIILVISNIININGYLKTRQPFLYSFPVQWHSL